MGIISIEKANNLYWLGRYTERVFTTLRKFYRIFDSMIDFDDAEMVYSEYCQRLSIPNIYTSGQQFVDCYIFDPKNPDSLYHNMERAYDNAIVLRDELSSNVVSYIQLALDAIASAKGTAAPLFQLQQVVDYLFAFWGCVDDYVENEECRNIMKTGKYAERIDLYIRLQYHTKDIEKEFTKFVNRMKKTNMHCNLDKLAELTEIINTKKEFNTEYQEALNCLQGIVEVV